MYVQKHVIFMSEWPKYYDNIVPKNIYIAVIVNCYMTTSQISVISEKLLSN
jgi:hypothetical protein